MYNQTSFFWVDSPTHKSVASICRTGLLAFLFLCCSGSLKADDFCTRGEGDSLAFKPCWYLGAGYGVSEVDPQGVSGNGWFTGDDSDNGYEGLIGWRFKQRWFAELKYADLGGAGLDNINPLRERAIPNAEIAYKVPSLMLGYRAFQWWDQFTLYGKLGVASIDTKPENGSDANLTNPVNSIDFEEQTSTQAVGGIGIEWQPRSSRWFARLNFDSYDKDANFLSLSINAYLGSKKSATGLTSSELPAIANNVDSNIAAEPTVPADNKPADSVPEIEAPQETTSAQRLIASCQALEALGPIYFESNRWGLSESQHAGLSAYAQILQQNPALSADVIGHADASGVVTVNASLAEKRAAHVYKHLLELGVDASQIRRRSEASSSPAADNGSLEGRAKNRRVEILAQGAEGC